MNITTCKNGEKIFDSVDLIPVWGFEEEMAFLDNILESLVNQHTQNPDQKTLDEIEHMLDMITSKDEWRMIRVDNYDGSTSMTFQSMDKFMGKKK